MMLAIAELSGWPLAIVICLCIIGAVKVLTGDWPWQR